MTTAASLHSLALTDLHLMGHPDITLILLVLGDGVRDVGGLAAELGCRQTRLSRNLTLLRVSGLVDFDRRGKRSVYRLTRAGKRMAKAVEKLAA